MASIALSPPGSEHGPCATPCEHKDCAQSRNMAACLCRWCSEPIGYDRHFYDEDPYAIHETCLHEEIAAERGAGA